MTTMVGKEQLARSQYTLPVLLGGWTVVSPAKTGLSRTSNVYIGDKEGGMGQAREKGC